MRTITPVPIRATLVGAALPASHGKWVAVSAPGSSGVSSGLVGAGQVVSEFCIALGFDGSTGAGVGMSGNNDRGGCHWVDA